MIIHILQLGAVCLTFLAYTARVAAVDCFVCSSETNERCGDNFRLIKALDNAYKCIGEQRCFKARGFRGTGAVGEAEVHRGCHDGQSQSDGCHSNERYNGISVNYCICSESFCNGSPRKLSMITSILVTSLCTLIYNIL